MKTSRQKIVDKEIRKDKRRAERAGVDPDLEWLLVNGFETLLEAALEAGQFRHTCFALLHLQSHLRAPKCKRQLDLDALVASFSERLALNCGSALRR